MSLPVDFPFVTTGDGFPVADAWRLEGFNDENTDRGRLHVSTVDVGGGVLRFDLFRHRDKAATDLVLQGQGPASSRVVLNSVGGSGLSGSVYCINAQADTLVLFVALATDKDLERHDDRIRGLLGEGPDQCDFADIWHLTSRQFYLNIQADYPPPSFTKDPLRFPGTGQVQAQGKRGLPDIHALDLWHLNSEGDWELKGLENVGDWRTWAALYSLHLIWNRRGRSGDDSIVARADRFLRDAEHAWSMVPVLVDADGDSIPEREVGIRSMYLERG